MWYNECRLCPRDCGVDRSRTVGACGMSHMPTLARAALHHWEEPCISGDRGSGAVFFSGCAMGCVYCQNRGIARGHIGRQVTPDRLCEIYFELRDRGAHNINLVSASHFLPHVVYSITRAKEQGFDLPFVYNTGGYERVDGIRRLEGLIDIYLPDYKYAVAADAAAYSNCPDYPGTALSAIDEMVRQQPRTVMENGIMKQGVIIRHLLLPGKVIASKIALRRIYRQYGDKVYLSIMSQYTPLPHIKDRYPELDRRVTAAEYNSLVDYAVGLGITKAFTQTGESAEESFIPEFDYEGI